MADEHDELVFKPVDGERFTKRIPVGQGRGIFEDVSGQGSIDVDERTRIRRAHVVSIRLNERAHERMPLVSFGDE